MLIDNKEESERQTNKQRQTGGHTDRQTGGQLDIQLDKQTNARTVTNHWGCESDWGRWYVSER